jgi:outer membrane protein TolC
MTDRAVSVAAGDARRASVLVAALLAVAVPASGQGAGAAEALPSDGLSLRKAIETGLRHATDLRVQRSFVVADRAALRRTSGRFDPRLQGTVTRLEQSAPSLPGGGASESDVLGYSLGLSVLSRAGISLRPELTLDQQEAAAGGVAGSSVAAARLGLTVPLMEGRWAEGPRATEEAARVDLGARRSDLRHTRSLTVLAVTRAYWAYRAAHRRLSVLRRSEDRARNLVEKLRRLVELEERPEADLHQALATLVDRRISRVAAEQAVVVSRRRLGIEMGLPAERIRRLPAPTEGFPDPDGIPVSPGRVPRLVEEALAQRSDLRALASREEADRKLLKAARDRLRPRVDLALSVGHRTTQAGTGVGELVTPFFQPSPGVSMTAEVQVEMPLGNDDARGLAVARRASVRRQEARLHDLRREISTSVRVSVEGLNRASTTVRQAARAVELNRQIVQNETRRSEFGVATNFDVILAEDRLNQARLARVTARRDLALQLVELRFATGSVFREGPGDPAVRLTDPTTVP